MNERKKDSPSPRLRRARGDIIPSSPENLVVKSGYPKVFPTLLTSNGPMGCISVGNSIRMGSFPIYWY